jgi:cobalt-zinc-cadmium efflux system membrane fusion protein
LLVDFLTRFYSMATPVTSVLPSSTPAPGGSAALGPPRIGWLRLMMNWIPNVLVFALLGSVFYAGHHTGWKLPKFAELTSTPQAPDEDWCEEHSVAESVCVMCQPALQPKLPSFGWCEKHGVHECVICHPELAQAKGQPQLPAYDTAAAIGVRPRNVHNSVDTLHTQVVQFSSAEAADRAGIEVDVVSTAPLREEIAAHGEAVFDPTHVAHLSSQVAGRVSRVFKRVGDKAAVGEVLALVDAAAVGQAKSQLLQAMHEVEVAKARHDRLKALSDTVASRSLVEAAEQHHEAEIKLIASEQNLMNLGFALPANLTRHDPRRVADELRLLGIPADIASSLGSQTQTSNLFPLVAPFAGTIAAANVVPGEAVDANTVAFVIADPRQMTLRLNVRQEDAALVALGQEVRFTTDDGAISAEGRIDWISPTVEPKSRTLPVRVSLGNQEGKLRDNTFGLGRILLRAQEQAIVVPTSAVQAAGDAQLVFVRDKNYFAEGSPKFFHVRQVRIGARNEKHVELLAGALPGEVVATDGSNVLLAQLLRGTMGAGCSHGHHH